MALPDLVKRSFRFLALGALILSIVPVHVGADLAQVRLRSPSGRFDLIFSGVQDQWSFYHHAIKGVAQETRDLYSISIVPVGAKNPVNAFYYADSAPAPAQNLVVQSMIWSPGEHYVVLPDKVKAREGNHVFQLVVPTEANKVWNLEADHVLWIDDHRFVGDLNTTEVPGGVMMFDAKVAKSELLVPADNGIGYQIAALHDHRVTVKQFLNKMGDTKTTWDVFTPACFDLDLDTLKKRSVACP
jgi:hypothetical protein